MTIKSLMNELKDLEAAKKELRNIQTQKCRLKKQKARKDYESKMTQVLKSEQLLKELVAYYAPKKVTTTMMTQEDIDKLNYDETIKAIKSIQSKKCNSQYDVDKSEYEKALKIEKMLLEHKKLVKPIEDTVVKKSSIQNLIRHLENQEKKIDTKYVIERLNDLLNGLDIS